MAAGHENGEPEEDQATFASLARALLDLAPVVDGVLDDSVGVHGGRVATTSERQSAVVALVGALDRLEAATATVGGASGDQLDHAVDGARSLCQWLTARTEADRPRCRGLLALHDELRGFVAIRGAWQAGRLGTAKVRLLLHAGRGLGAQLARDQAHLIDRIAPLRVSWARVVLARWREAVSRELDHSPDDPRPTDQPVNSTRYAAGVGSELVVTTILDPVRAAEFRSLVDAEIDRRFRIGEYHAEDGRTAEERRFDAQLELMRRGAVVQTEGGEPKKSVLLLVDLRHLLPDGQLDALEATRFPCGLADGTPLERERVLTELVDASVTAVLGFYGVSGRFRPVGEITTNRLASASQRRLLRARDQGCMFPGCDAPAARCRAHHEPPFERSHRTTTDELVLLCAHPTSSVTTRASGSSSTQTATSS